MLDKAHRLTKGQHFAGTIRRGRRAGSGTLVVHLAMPEAMPEAEAPGVARVGFVVGKSVGGAVIRNRVKRRLRHLVRDRLDVLPAASDVVVRALPPARDATADRLAADLDRTLQRVLRYGAER
jgi:ribonuclease P protein component